MALVDLGNQTADWNTKTPIEFNTFAVRDNRAVALFLQQVEAPVETRNQYLAILARLETSYGNFETALEAKYFPNTFGLVFAIALPSLDWDVNIDVTVRCLPKEFKPGTATDKVLDFNLQYDDNLQREISFPMF